MQTSFQRELKEDLVCPPLFKVEKNDNVSFILGTCHRLPLSALPETFIHKIDQAKSLVTETLAKLTLEILYETQILTHIGNDVWFGNLSSEARSVFIKLAFKFFRQRLNRESVSFSNINPELAHWICHLSNRPDNYMDTELIAKFGEKVWGLEGAERFEGLTKKKESLWQLEKRLRATLAIESAESKEEKYLTGEEVTDPYKIDFNLSTKRNLRWINKIIDYHATLEGPVLFAVGASHLAGAAGILELLKKYGFEVTRINSLGSAVPFPSLSSYSDSTVLKRVEDKVDEHVKNVIHRAIHLPEKCSNLVSGYLGFSIYQQPKFLSEHIELEEKAEGVDIRVLDQPPNPSRARLG